MRACVCGAAVILARVVDLADVPHDVWLEPQPSLTGTYVQDAGLGNVFRRARYAERNVLLYSEHRCRRLDELAGLEDLQIARSA